MMETRHPGGRPPKAPDERFIRAPLTLPPDVWEEFKEVVPARERSAVIAALLRKEIRRRRREKVTLAKEGEEQATSR